MVSSPNPTSSPKLAIGFHLSNVRLYGYIRVSGHIPVQNDILKIANTSPYKNEPLIVDIKHPVMYNMSIAKGRREGDLLLEIKKIWFLNAVKQFWYKETRSEWIR